MLVLSRRLNEKIVFPRLNISVQVVAVKPGVVRLGIDAPVGVTVLREEVPDREAEWGPPPARPADPTVAARLLVLNKLLRNRLRAGSADLKVLRRQLQAGLVHDAEATLDKIEEDFQLVRQ